MHSAPVHADRGNLTTANVQLRKPASNMNAATHRPAGFTTRGN